MKRRIVCFAIFLIGLSFGGRVVDASPVAKACDAETAQQKKEYVRMQNERRSRSDRWRQCVGPLIKYHSCTAEWRAIRDAEKKLDEARRVWYQARSFCLKNGFRAQREAIKQGLNRLDPNMAKLVQTASGYHYLGKSIKTVQDSRASFESRINSLRRLSLNTKDFFASRGGRPNFAWMLSGALLSESTQHLVGIASFANFEFQTAMSKFDQWHYNATYRRPAAVSRPSQVKPTQPQSSSLDSVDWSGFLGQAAGAVATFGAIQQQQRRQSNNRYQRRRSAPSPPRSYNPGKTWQGTDAVPGGRIYRGQGIP